ncbi:hypothetical protein [Capnocytophaga sp.]|uniref:hypothetical protein n=1 Tax=Capnocytophaga sp. TaxID=44737 RepID=UPI0026DC5363|nr:hypothetical protein [Capnocytophaga sp.]MDO5106056.1 hypothetical protein [Capnocytophaga sp.]
MKKVSDKQIELLYEFTRKHYVEYYDVQTELVDHLANAIETHWQSAPNNSFEEVLQKEFRKFGVFGFMDVLEEKTKQMSKRYNRILWQKTKEFFTIPKIITTFCVGVFIFLLFTWFENAKITVPAMSSTIFITSFVFMIKNKRIFKQNNGKKWLFEDIILRLNNYTFFFFFPHQMSVQFWRDFPDNQTAYIIYSAAFTFLLVLVYVIMVYLPKNREKYLAEVYPEYKLKTA